jgi:murein DD-endopeptidase MepM/ murein hydrolase activator NlpD
MLDGWMRLAAAALALAGAAPLAAQQADSTALARGRQYTQWLYAGQTDSLYARFSPQMRAAIPSVDALTSFQQRIQEQAGAETEVVRERIMDPSPAPGLDVYVRSVRFSNAPMVFDVVMAMDSAGVVQGFSVRPQQQGQQPAPSQFLEYQTKTPLRLPFEGDWYVFWGGRTVPQNYHAAHRDQRFAYDLVVMRDGSSHTGDGTRLDQYHCWGQPILAPGAGTVVTALDSLADQQPGQMDPTNAAGNHVVVDHGNGEFSLLAHLRRGSVAVRPGQRVAAGQKLGECGNSGNTSEPHLHYHLQNGPVFGQAAGIPAQFNGYTADGQPVPRGEPLQGQTVRHQP